MHSDSESSRRVTCKIVDMKMEFAFERHKKVVFGLAAALIFDTARIMAGC